MFKHLLVLNLAVVTLSMGSCPRSADQAPPTKESVVTTDFSALGSAIENDLASRKAKDSIVDGQPALRIGKQTWTTYNLNVTAFRNGDPIQQAQSVQEFEKAGEQGIPAWCLVGSDQSGGSRFGRMYNLAAVTDVRGLAPKGWHVPSSSEWQELKNFLGNDAAAKLKSKVGWITEHGEPANGSNETGFSVYPGGLRIGAGGEGAAFQLTGFWTSSPANAEYQYVVEFLEGSDVSPSPMNKSGAYYIRLVHD